MTGNTEMHLLVTDTVPLKKKVGAWIRKLVSTSVTTICLMAVRSCWILAGTGASQTCSMGDISGEYAVFYLPWKNWDIFSFQKWCTDPCDMGPCIIMLKHGGG